MKMHWVWIWVTWYKNYTFETTQVGAEILISFFIPDKEGGKVPVNYGVCHWRWLKEGGREKAWQSQEQYHVYHSYELQVAMIKTL